MWVLLPVVVIGVLSGLGQVMMRAGGRGATLSGLLSLRGLLEHPLWAGGILLCWCCGLAWAWLVTRLKLASGLPILTGATYLAAVTASWLFLREGVTARDMAGFALVLLGVTLIATR